jgi:pyridoxine 5-phosphate synthase
MSPRIRLGVNIAHAATLRQARYRQHSATVGGAVEPDPVALALVAERAGADGITVHLREDRRHIQERDVWRLRECMGTRLNLEMACTPAMIDFALRLQPHSVCLVPESREEVTTEGGLDVVGHRGKVQEVAEAMRGAGIVTSLFIDPDPAQIVAAAELRAPWIELHTGAYAEAFDQKRERNVEIERLVAASKLAHGLGLNVNSEPASLGVDRPVWPLTTLRAEAGGRSYDVAAMTASLVDEMASALPVFFAHGFAPFQAEYERRSVLLGRRVKFTDGPGAVVVGRAVSIGDDGRLYIRVEGGQAAAGSEGVCMRACAPTRPRSAVTCAVPVQ